MLRIAKLQAAEIPPCVSHFKFCGFDFRSRNFLYCPQPALRLSLLAELMETFRAEYFCVRCGISWNDRRNDNAFAFCDEFFAAAACSLKQQFHSGLVFSVKNACLWNPFVSSVADVELNSA